MHSILNFLNLKYLDSCSRILMLYSRFWDLKARSADRVQNQRACGGVRFAVEIGAAVYQPSQTAGSDPHVRNICA